MIFAPEKKSLALFKGINLGNDTCSDSNITVFSEKPWNFHLLN